MNQIELNRGLADFIANSPTPFHAASQMANSLASQGYTELKESDYWDCQAGGKYYVLRNDSSVVAFALGDSPLEESGLRLIGAHTDSPCLRVKPQPDLQQSGYLCLGVEIYGGVLLNTWFDRDLSLAGRVTYQTPAGVSSSLIDFERPIAVVPSLAIHLDKQANKDKTINRQTDMPPILALLNESVGSFNELLLQQLKSQHPDSSAEKVLSYELSFYDTQKPATIGLKEEFFAGARLDNLLSCYVGLQSLLDSEDGQSRLLVCNDHEEVGSNSAAGAAGTLLKSVLERLAPEHQQFARLIDHSMMISADNAHGIHPNFAGKHDQNHGPLLNHGPVIKMNTSQRYASNSETVGVYSRLCEQQAVPFQSFVVRSDMGCGSTIGPITATELGVKTLDVGVPTFAMHSIRELAGSEDAHHLYKSFCGFFNAKSLFGEN